MTSLVMRDEGSVATLPSSRLLRRKEAAHYLTNNRGIPRTAKTLAKEAVQGGGPAFRKSGRVPLYAIEDLDAWACSKLTRKVHSTSELKEVA